MDKKEDSKGKQGRTENTKDDLTPLDFSNLERPLLNREANAGRIPIEDQVSAIDKMLPKEECSPTGSNPQDVSALGGAPSNIAQAGQSSKGQGSASGQNAQGTPKARKSKRSPKR